MSEHPTLLAGESHCYPYRVDFDDPSTADASTEYTNTATVTISTLHTPAQVDAFGPAARARVRDLAAILRAFDEGAMGPGACPA